MKKYILFFLSIVLLLGTLLVYNTINATKSREATFSEAGYILNNLSDRYYFYEEETYSKSYDNKIVFNDTEGDRVTIEQDNFIHYTSGSIEALKESVLLDLSNINADPIVYYNISGNKEIKKVSNRYTIKNLKSDIKFDNAIWKISDNKYIILADNLKITLSSGTERELEDYIEIEYSDNEIVNLYNQEVSFQTISSDSYIELSDNIKINLGTKIVSSNSENKMSLENMVINSNDNVKIVDLADYEVKDENNTTDENIEENQTSTTTTTTQTNGTVSDTNETFEPINIDFDTNKNEEKIDESKPLSEPTFKVNKMDISAVSMLSEIEITDTDDLLSKDDEIIVQVRNDITGKIIQYETVEYGEMKFDVYTERLIPNTQYSLIISAKYIINEISYSKNFVYKTFVTADIGLQLTKDGFTDESLSFEMKFDEGTLTESAVVKIYDMEDKEVKEGVLISKNSPSKIVTFNGLNSNTSYKIRICDIMYDGALRKGATEGTDYWVVEYEYKTLKKKASFTANTSIDKRNSNFNLYVENITDVDNAIQNYQYYLYEIISGDKLDTNPSYSMKSENTEQVVSVSFDVTGDEKIVKNKYYQLKVVGTMYDNEKYVEVECYSDSILVMSDKQFPTLEWRPQEVTATTIIGDICILDENSAVDLKDNIIVEYKNSIGENVLYANSKYQRKGNEILIHIDCQELKAQESYIFSIRSTIDLGEKDEEGESVVRKNTYLGDIRVTTRSYPNLRAVYRDVSSNAENKSNVFTTKLRLLSQDESNSDSIDNLSSLKLILQAGSSYNENNASSVITISEGNYTDYEDKNNPAVSFKDLVSNKGINISPSMIGGGSEQSYTENYYVIGVTATVDGTSYSNKIPLVAESATGYEKVTDEISYTDKNKNITYTAAWMLAKGKDTQSSDGMAPTVEKITNNDVDIQYKKDNLNGDTIVAYKVKANFSPGTLATKSIIYSAWDSQGNAVKNENGEQLSITMDYTEPNNIPEAIFYLNNGDSKNKTSGMYRGYSYYFTYKVVYESGATEFDDQYKSTVVNPLRQEPTITMYPLNSKLDEVNEDKGQITYMYSSHDPDFAIVNTEGTSNVEFILSSSSGDLGYTFEREKKNGTVIFNNLTKEYNYTLKYKYSLSSLEYNKYKELGIVKFEDIITINSGNVGITVDTEQTTNVITINFRNKIASNDVLSRVAAVDVDFKTSETNVHFNKLKLLVTGSETNRNYRVDFDLLNGENVGLIPLLERSFEVEVTFYYDNGVIGFPASGENTEGKYAVYMNKDYNYLKLNSNSWEYAEFVIGNMYNYNITYNDNNAVLNLVDLSGKAVRRVLNYGYSSLEYDTDEIILQKQIATSKVSANAAQSNVSVVPGIQINFKELGLTEVKFKAVVSGPNAEINRQNIVFEVYPIDEDNPVIDPNNVMVYDNNSSTSNRKYTINGEGNYVLGDLPHKTRYKMKIRYAIEDNVTKYFFDRTYRQTGYEYEFNTGTNITISDVEVSYVADKYTNRDLKVQYKIKAGEYSLYDKMEYVLYYKDTNGQDVVVYDQTEINDKTDNSILKKHLIDIGPKNNDLEAKEYYFEYGKNYIIKIIPIVTIEGEDTSLEATEKTFKIKELSDIENGARATRYDEEREYKGITYKAPTIGVNITIKDVDKIVSDTVNKETIDSTGIGKYKLSAYYVDEHGSKQSIKIYTIPADATEVSATTIVDITDTVLNINQHATNYAVYLYDVDFGRNIVVEYIIDTNTTNNQDNVITSTIQCCNIEGINNEAQVDIGKYNVSSEEIVDSDKYKLKLDFYDSYHLNTINMIQYTIYQQTDNGPVFQNSGILNEDSIRWVYENVSDALVYYSLKLPFELDKTKTYIITLNLYNTDWSINYTDNMDRIQNSKFGDKIDIFYVYKK